MITKKVVTIAKELATTMTSTMKSTTTMTITKKSTSTTTIIEMVTTTTNGKEIMSTTTKVMIKVEDTLDMCEAEAVHEDHEEIYFSHIG